MGVSKPAQGLFRPRRVIANTAARRRWIVATVDIVGGGDDDDDGNVDDLCGVC
jgi:hypothetical protein